MSLEDASKRLEVAFKDTESRLDAVGKKVDSALAGLTDHQNGKYLRKHKPTEIVVKLTKILWYHLNYG